MQKREGCGGKDLRFYRKLYGNINPVFIIKNSPLHLHIIYFRDKRNNLHFWGVIQIYTHTYTHTYSYTFIHKTALAHHLLPPNRCTIRLQ